MLAPHLKEKKLLDTTMFSVHVSVAHDPAGLGQEMAPMPNAEVVCRGQLVSAFFNGH